MSVYSIFINRVQPSLPVSAKKGGASEPEEEV